MKILYSCLCLWLLILLYVSLTLSDTNIKGLDEKIVNQLLANYDKRFNPNGYTTDTTSTTNNGSNGTTGAAGSGSGGPVIVRNSIYIRSLEYVDSRRQEWKLQMTFRQQWLDERLAYADDNNNQVIPYVQLGTTDQIWIPDTMISNSRETVKHTDVVPNILVRIMPDGQVLMSMRMTVTLDCPMDLHDYPFDRQTCPIYMASYGYTMKHLVYLWKENDPVQVSKKLNVRQLVFKMENYSTSYCNARTNTGEYSCYKLEMQFQRQTRRYIWQWFVPTVWLTFVGFVSFLIPVQNYRRPQLLLVMLLAQYLHNQVANWRSAADDLDVSYLTLKDMYFISSFGFLLAALLEYGMVWFVDSYSRRRCRSGPNSLRDSNIQLVTNNNNNNIKDDQLSDNMKSMAKFSSMESNDELVVDSPIVYYYYYWFFTNKVDLICAILFPMAYLGYLIYYFS